MPQLTLNFTKTKENCIELMKEEIPFLSENFEKEISVSDNKSSNILIEGENYHALNILRYTHFNKINSIYIDPPYNTGNRDFVYNDKFVDEDDKFGHSKWLSFMENRLKIARELLTDNGSIFISIDDNEQAYLKILCDQIFGEDNFISHLIWKKKNGVANDSKFVDTQHEYILIYAKNKQHCIFNKIPQDIKADDSYNLEDEFINIRGKYKLDKLDRGSIQYSLSMDYGIEAPDGTFVFPGGHHKSGNGEWSWKWSKDKLFWGIKNNFIVIKQKNKNSPWAVYKKQYQFVDNENNSIKRGQPLSSIINGVSNKTSNSEIKNIFNGKNLFDYSKPIDLIKKIVFISTNKNSIILDFFAGSGTTGQAVAELNKEDGGARQFILVTNNDKSDKLPGGICEEVTYQRLKKTIGSENLKYFKVDYFKKETNPSEQLSKDNRMLSAIKIKYNCFNELEHNSHRDYEYRLVKNDDSSSVICIWMNGIGPNEKFFTEKMNEITKNNAHVIIKYDKEPRYYYDSISRNDN